MLREPRYRADRAEVDKIAVREPMLLIGNPAGGTEEYAPWETTATAWTEVATTQPTIAGAIALNAQAERRRMVSNSPPSLLDRQRDRHFLDSGNIPESGAEGVRMKMPVWPAFGDSHDEQQTFYAPCPPIYC